MIYIVSDLHLEHENIIKYCDRPFASTQEMNETIIQQWNQVVDLDERVLFLGDLVPFEKRDPRVQGWLNKLNGEITFIRGNHDETVPIESNEKLTYSLSNYELYLTHYPEDIPDDWEGWGIYGHHHNNDPEAFPFLDPEKRRINVSIELLGFEPLPVSEMFACMKRQERLIVRPGVDQDVALQTGDS